MKNGQGALEYLLLIGGAILVAVIVISILVGLGGGSVDEATLVTAHGICAKFSDNQCASQVTTIKNQVFPCVSLGASQCRAVKATPITACGATLAAGQSYYLPDDLPPVAGTCISFDLPNIKLYCNGKKISTTGGQQAVLINDGVSGALIQNCAIEAPAGTGIFIRGTNNSIIGNSIQGNNLGINITPTGSGNLLQNNFTCRNGISGIIDVQNTIAPQNPSSSGNACSSGACFGTVFTNYVCDASNDCPIPC